MAPSVVSLILGITGNTMSVFAFVSTVPTFCKIVKRRSVEKYSEHPYVLSLLNGLLWSWYGYLKIHHGGLLILTVNLVGCAFQYIYLALYIFFAPYRKRVSSGTLVLLVHLSVMGLLVVVELIVKEPRTRMLVVGVTSCMGAVGMFASPLTIIGTVICTKSVEYMPFLLSLSFALRSGTWCAYGYAIHDIFIEITNTIGTVLGITQLTLYFVYFKKPQGRSISPLVHTLNPTKQEEEEEEEEDEDVAKGSHSVTKLSLERPTNCPLEDSFNTIQVDT